MKRLSLHLAAHIVWITLLAIALTGFASPSGNQEGGFKVDKPEPPHVIRMEPIRIEGELAPRAVDAHKAQGWTPTECRTRTECLARIYFHEHEAGSRPDQLLHYHVLQRVGGGRVTMRAMKAYSSRATGVAPPGGERTRWISQLYVDTTDRPAAYNRSEPWSEVLPRWQHAVHAAARDIAAPPEPPSCRYRADHWGGRGIDDRSDDGWIESECEGTLNRGWCDPALGDCHEEEAEEPVRAGDERERPAPDTA